MVVEIALIDVKPGHEREFASAYEQARRHVASAPGCHWLRMTRGIESPSRFVLLVEWESIAAHEGFRSSDAFPQWRALIGPHFAAPPLVEHFEAVEG